MSIIDSLSRILATTVRQQDVDSVYVRRWRCLFASQLYSSGCFEAYNNSMLHIFNTHNKIDFY